MERKLLRLLDEFEKAVPGLHPIEIIRLNMIRRIISMVSRNTTVATALDTELKEAEKKADREEHAQTVTKNSRW